MIQTDGKIDHVLGLEESILLKWLYYPRQATESKQSLPNDQWHSSQNWNNFLKMWVETHKTPNSQSNPEKEKQSWKNWAPRPQTTLQSYSNQDSMVLAQNQKYRSIEQDRKPRNKPTYLWSTNLWQRRREYTMQKESLNKWCWENWTATCKKMKLEHSLTLSTWINSRWIKDLNIRPDTIKLLEESTGQTLADINHSRIFSDPPPRVMTIKTKINQWDLIKLRNFCIAKETTKKEEEKKDNLLNGRKSLQMMQPTRA